MTRSMTPRTRSPGYPYECLNSPDYPCATASTLLEYGYIGNVYLHGDNADVGMVILDSPIYLDEYASLAAEGSVDDLPVGTEVTVTGYGVSGEKPSVISYRERLMATAFIVSTRNTNTAGFNVQLSTNPGKGRGGSCFGDSGGPILYDATDIILGVNSFVVNGQCAGVGFAYRTDQEDVLAGFSKTPITPTAASTSSGWQTDKSAPGSLNYGPDSGASRLTQRHK